jgi:hypothetical protein
VKKAGNAGFRFEDPGRRRERLARRAELAAAPEAGDPDWQTVALTARNCIRQRLPDCGIRVRLIPEGARQEPFGLGVLFGADFHFLFLSLSVMSSTSTMNASINEYLCLESQRLSASTFASA